MLGRFLPKTSFSSYEDFSRSFRVDVPDGFNFAWDVVDVAAAEEPSRTALVWCDEKGSESTFTFGQMRELSMKTAVFFLSLGIGKGDPVMLILKRRYEYWFCLLGLHRIGAIAIPATHLLTKKDIVYRNNAADVKAIVSVGDEKVLDNVDAALPESPTLRHRIALGVKRKGWLDFHDHLGRADSRLARIRTENADPSLLYFTSGTTGMPKMVQHDFAYPLGHIVTAKYWQNVQDGGLHLTVADTGWAKAAWGKIYGQWLCGS
ncbi:MAG: AMP-binding protein, partial [Spirochaetia bacterium]